MKKTFTLILFALPFALMLVAGCVKKNNDADAKVIYPSGRFKGLFSRIHYNTRNSKYDTLSCNIELSLDPILSAFAVTGDTSAVHAGSKGTYSLDAFYLAFSDNTLATADGKKAHLTGAYLYTYDGTALKVQALQGDTLKFNYNLKAY